MRNKLSIRAKDIIFGSLVAAVVASLTFAGGFALRGSTAPPAESPPVATPSEQESFSFFRCSYTNSEGVKVLILVKDVPDADDREVFKCDDFTVWPTLEEALPKADCGAGSLAGKCDEILDTPEQTIHIVTVEGYTSSVLLVEAAAVAPESSAPVVVPETSQPVSDGSLVPATRVEQAWRCIYGTETVGYVSDPSECAVLFETVSKESI